MRDAAPRTANALAQSPDFGHHDALEKVIVIRHQVDGKRYRWLGVRRFSMRDIAARYSFRKICRWDADKSAG